MHNGFAKPVGGGDEHHVAKARVGVEREHHATRAAVGAHHLLNAGRQRHLRVIEALVDAVSDGPVVEQRGEYVAHRLEDGGLTLHVEEGLLLAREGRLRQIFGGG